jgi:predicted nucleic-acid-binding protein
MIGVDPNVLLRLFVLDDPRQSELALEFFGARSAADPAFLSVVAVVELVWLLSDGYDYDHGTITGVLSRLLSSVDFALERRELVIAAVALATEKKIDFADFLIAGIGIAAGCRTVVTFDKPASRRIPGMELLK